MPHDCAAFSEYLRCACHVNSSQSSKAFGFVARMPFTSARSSSSSTSTAKVVQGFTTASTSADEMHARTRGTVNVSAWGNGHRIPGLPSLISSRDKNPSSWVSIMRSKPWAGPEWSSISVFVRTSKRASPSLTSSPAFTAIGMQMQNGRSAQQRSY